MRKASGILEIPYFQQEDAGTYECVAENSRGLNTVKGKLSFYGRWFWHTWIFDRRAPHLSDLLRLKKQTQPVLWSSRQRLVWRARGGRLVLTAHQKWLKAVSHDASNILIQIKGVMGMMLSPSTQPCWWALYWAPPDGSMIDVQLDWRLKPVNVLYIAPWHICQGHNLHRGIWIDWKRVSSST